MTPASTFSLTAGQSVNFTVTATDPDATGFITNLRATNPPPGMTFVPTSFTAGNPVSLQVSWTTPPIVATNQVVTFEATDNNGAVRSTQVSITTTAVNRPPTASAGGPYTIAEGDSLTLSAAASGDPDVGDTLTYAWDVNGDGVFTDAFGVSPTLSWVNLQALGITDGQATRNVRVRVSDGTAPAVESTATLLTVLNALPLLNISGPSSVNEGDTYTLALSAIDPGSDTIQQWTINWGDGPPEAFPGNPSAVTHVYADGPNTYTITATATDEDGTYSTASIGVAVNVSVDNVPPALTISGASGVAEGATYTLGLAVTHPGVDTVTGWDISWGDGPVEHVTGNPAAVTHVYADGDNTYTISATATDEDGTYTSNSIAVAVNDVPPTLVLSGTGTAVEGTPYTLTLSATDPGADTVQKWTINWDDGSDPEVVPGDASSVTHTFADGDATYQVTATATNDDGTFAAGPHAVAVANAPREVVVSGEHQVAEGAVYTLSLGSSDPGADTVSEWTVIWGDFSVDTYPGTATQATHVYRDNHDHHFEVQVLAADEDGTWGPGVIDVDVENVAPEATIGDTGPVTYGEAFTVSLSDPTDPSEEDTTAGFHYAFALDADALASATYDNSGADPFASFTENAGFYTVYARVIDKDGGFTQYSTVLRVNKADATINVSGYTGVYNGAAHGATGTVTGVNGEVLSGLDLGSSFANYPGGTAHWAFTDATGNYNDASGTAAIVITKATAGITVNGYSVVYDGAAHGLSGTAVGVDGADLSGFLTYGAGVTNVPGGAITWGFDAGPNYRTAAGSAMVTVTKADATIDVSGYTGVYSGVAHGATGSVTGVNGEALIGLDLGARFTNVPGGTAHWTFTDVTGNYHDAGGTVDDAIPKANATISVSGYTGTYDGAAHGATGTAKGVGGVALGGLSLGGGFTNAPGGTANWAFAGGTNYHDATGSVAIVINKASVSYQIGSVSHVYGTPTDLAAALGTTFATGVNGETLSIAYSNPGNTASANVGTYALTGAASNGTGLLSNYAVTLASGTLAVTQATLTGDAAMQDALNMAKQGKLTITISNVSGLVNGDTLAIFLSTAEYYITVGTNNYAFVPTGVTSSGSSITITYTLKDSALVTRLAAELADNTSGATAVAAGFYMQSANYTFDDDYLTRLFSTAH